jgi:hypothetical protein
MDTKPAERKSNTGRKEYIAQRVGRTGKGLDRKTHGHGHPPPTEETTCRREGCRRRLNHHTTPL